MIRLARAADVAAVTAIVKDAYSGEEIGLQRVYMSKTL
jgi:hypothetical protein